MNYNIELEKVSEFIYNHFQNVTYSNRNFKAKCAICGDSKKSNNKRRFNLIYKAPDNIVYNCFNCGSHGSIISLAMELNKCSFKEAIREFSSKFNEDEIIKTFTKKEKKIKKEDKPRNNLNYVLDNCYSLRDIPDSKRSEILIEYLKRFKKERKIEIDLYVAHSGEFKNRIIIPVYEGDDLVFFQGRSIKHTLEPKYLNPKIEKSNIILNKDNFDRNKFIIVTEGLLDALSIGEQGTSSLGVSIKEDFLENLFSFTDKGVIIALDNDLAGKKFLEDNFLGKKAYNKFRKKLKYFFMPKKYQDIKDLNELKVLEELSSDELYKLVEENSFSYFESIVKYSF